MKLENCLILIIVVFLNSCTFKNNPEFQISNESEFIFDSIIIGASNKNTTVIKNLKKAQIIDGEIMFDKSITTDGSYFLKMYIKNKLWKSTSFGYFTNGGWTI